MPDMRRRNCQSCRRSSDVTGPISWRGLCTDCSIDHVAKNVVGLMTHQGEPMHRWRLGMIRCAGGLTLDDVAKLLETAANG